MRAWHARWQLTQLSRSAARLRWRASSGHASALCALAQHQTGMQEPVELRVRPADLRGSKVTKCCHAEMLCLPRQVTVLSPCPARVQPMSKTAAGQAASGCLPDRTAATGQPSKAAGQHPQRPGSRQRRCAAEDFTQRQARRCCTLHAGAAAAHVRNPRGGCCQA